MSLPEWISAFIEPLEASAIPYAVTGSVASMLYGELRLTNDIDISIWITRADIPKILAAFPADHFYVPDAASIASECARPGGGFNVIDHASGNKADLYVARRGPIEQWVLDHRRRIHSDSVSMWLVPPEYVIAKKLEFYREGKSPKHLRDIRAMLLAKTPLDQTALDRLIDDQDLWREWREASA